jgi:hypothetical protein
VGTSWLDVVAEAALAPDRVRTHRYDHGPVHLDRIVVLTADLGPPRVPDLGTDLHAGSHRGTARRVRLTVEQLVGDLTGRPIDPNAASFGVVARRAPRS